MIPNKKFKSSVPRIGTHDGTFHCDEILAIYLLKQIPEYKNAEIVRSRKDEVLETCDVVVDVGAKYEPTEYRFDHHQKSFTETFSSLRPEFGNKYTVTLSSAGIIYVHFGEQAISNIFEEKFGGKLSEKNLKIIYEKIYKSLIREVDGIDNGVPMFDGEPLYRITTDLSGRVKNFNPSWDEPQNDIDERFHKAMDYVGNEFNQKIFNIKSWLAARHLVLEAVNNRKSVYETGEILELTNFCPWKEHLADVEKELNLENIPKYVLYRDGEWRVIAVPKTPSSFVCRKSLHEDWRGLRNEELQKVSGVEDAVFCHATGFIGGAKSREGALKMAIQSLNGDYC